MPSRFPPSDRDALDDGLDDGSMVREGQVSEEVVDVVRLGEHVGLIEEAHLQEVNLALEAGDLLVQLPEALLKRPVLRPEASTESASAR